MLQVKIVNDSPWPLPAYATEASAGVDLHAHLEADITLQPLARCVVPTGLYIELPVGYEAQVRPRSGLAIKHGITVINSPGTIDADYRGELRVLLINLGPDPVRVEHGARIAQLVVAPVAMVDAVEVDDLPPSERGSGGFGSTG